jgi:hypothetical protein
MMEKIEAFWDDRLFDRRIEARVRRERRLEGVAKKLP